MPDADLRALERQARAGDPEAARAVRRARRRTQAPPPWILIPPVNYADLERRILLQGRQGGKALLMNAFLAELSRAEVKLTPPHLPDPRPEREVAAERLLGGLRRPLWWPAP